MRACHSFMRPIAACWRADGAGLRDAERHMVGVWRVARQFWKALNECFQESIGSWGPRANPASKEKVLCLFAVAAWNKSAKVARFRGDHAVRDAVPDADGQAAGDREEARLQQQLRHGSGAASEQMAPRPRLISPNAQAFFLALLLALSEVAFHTTRVAVWTWQPGLQPVVPQTAEFASAWQSTWPAASPSVMSKDSNQSGLALQDLNHFGRHGCAWSVRNGAGGAAGGGSGADEGSDGWGGAAAPLAFIFPASKAVLQDDVASAVQLQQALLLSAAMSAGMHVADVILLSLYKPGEAAGPISQPMAAAVEELWRPPPAQFATVVLDLSIMTEHGAVGDELIVQFDDVPSNTNVSVLTSVVAALFNKPDAELGLLHPNDAVANPAVVLSSLGDCVSFRAVPRDCVGGDCSEERPTHPGRRASTEQPAPVDRGGNKNPTQRFMCKAKVEQEGTGKAQGVWQKKYQTFLGRTEADVEQQRADWIDSFLRPKRRAAKTGDRFAPNELSRDRDVKRVATPACMAEPQGDQGPSSDQARAGPGRGHRAEAASCSQLEEPVRIEAMKANANWFEQAAARKVTRCLGIL